MANYQICPICGAYTWRKDKSPSKSSSTGKKISGAAAGAAIGSALLPGFGTVLGGAAGYFGSKLFGSDDDDTQVPILYNFTCPKCGHNWDDGDLDDDEEYEDDDEENEDEDDYDEGHEYFTEKFNYFIDKIEEIIKSKKSAHKFINSIDEYYISDSVNAEISYLKAIVLLEYLYNTSSEDKTLATEGLNYIEKSLGLLEDEEFELIKLIFTLYLIDNNNKNALKQCSEIISKCPDIASIENTYLKNKHLQEVYDDILESVLLDTYFVYDEKQKKDSALKCLEMMNKINTNFSIVISNVLLSDFYYDKSVENPPKAYEYVKNAVEKVSDFEFNPEIGFHKQWLRALVRLGYCYLSGYGTSTNAKKGYELSLRASELGDSTGTANLAECYEKGVYVFQDKNKALKLYQQAQDMGLDFADKIAELEHSLNIQSSQRTVSNSSSHEKKCDHDIFISYSRRDTDLVNEFVSLLEKAGYKIWIDRDGIESGDAFKSVIVDAIEGCQLVIFFASEASNSSPWTAKEIGVAVDSKKEIIPIKLDSSRYDKSVRLDLINIDFIDFTDLSKKQACKDKLLRTLQIKIIKKSNSNGDAGITADEQEYLDAYKDALDGNTLLSDKERKMLERVRKMYGITESRAKELENMVSNVNLSEDEHEYLDAYKEAMEGGISDKERRILDKLLKASGISKDRAAIIEKMA